MSADDERDWSPTPSVDRIFGEGAPRPLRNGEAVDDYAILRELTAAVLAAYERGEDVRVEWADVTAVPDLKVLEQIAQGRGLRLPTGALLLRRANGRSCWLFRGQLVVPFGAEDGGT